ncbi:MAG: flagellar filament capping protein FliD [Bryobacteraceae bacterium]|jgi:flagellar hook-associated protein 2
MGTISSSLPTATSNSIDTNSSSSGSSSLSSSSPSNPTGIFTGTSAYSQDFQNVINRAVAIASLPITLLTDQQTTLTNQSNELSTIDTKFTALQTAIQGISDAMSGSSYQTTISDPKSVSASVSDGVQEGVYSINVVTPGSYATSLTTNAWDSTADPSGNPSTYSLVVGTQSYSFTPSDNSAATVASTINSQYGNMVNATAVNVGSAASPEYKISLQSTSLGATTLDIQDSSGNSLQTQQQPPGEEAEYEVDNSGVTVQSTSSMVTIATGLTVDMLAASDGPVDVTVTRSTSALNTALSTFADAYNAAATELDNQHGQSGGALQGQAIVNSLSQALASISTYSSSDSIGYLKNLGLELGKDGQLTYTATTLMSTDFGNSSGVDTFLGSATGGGFLEAATNAINSLEDPTTGLIKTSETDLQSQISNLGTTISNKQTQVSNLQTQLQNQMAQADAAIATMEQQYSYLNSMFSAMQTADQMYANE